MGIAGTLRLRYSRAGTAMSKSISCVIHCHSSQEAEAAQELSKSIEKLLERKCGSSVLVQIIDQSIQLSTKHSHDFLFRPSIVDETTLANIEQ